jgi:hypothetical protein
MPEVSASVLNGWDSFYVIVGSSSAALTGLMFVVVTVMPEARKRLGGTAASLSAFATPTIVHFCGALLISAIFTAPWNRLRLPGLAVSASGFAGLVYAVIVTRRVHGLKEYTPVFQDWLWHVYLPIVSYLTMMVAGLLLQKDTMSALFGVAAATLLLLFVGIHNAWDSVTYITFEIEPDPPKDKR